MNNAPSAPPGVQPRDLAISEPRASRPICRLRMYSPPNPRAPDAAGLHQHLQLLRKARARRIAGRSTDGMIGSFVMGSSAVTAVPQLLCKRLDWTASLPFDRCTSRLQPLRNAQLFPERSRSGSSKAHSPADRSPSQTTLYRNGHAKVDSYMKTCLPSFSRIASIRQLRSGRCLLDFRTVRRSCAASLRCAEGDVMHGAGARNRPGFAFGVHHKRRWRQSMRRLARRARMRQNAPARDTPASPPHA